MKSCVVVIYVLGYAFTSNVCFNLLNFKFIFCHFMSLTAPIVSSWMDVAIHANDKKVNTVSREKLAERHNIVNHFQVIRIQIYMDGTNITRNSIKNLK